MEENKKGFIVNLHLLSGIDWHDTSCRNEYFTDGDGRPIVFADRNEAMEAVARDVHRQIATMRMEERHRGKTTIKTLSCPPDINLVRLAVLNGKDFFVTPDEELSADWDAKHSALTLHFLHGQLEEMTEYGILELTPAMRVFAVENFLAARKGVPTVKRLRSRAYAWDELDLALARLGEVKGHLWGAHGTDRERSCAEFAVFDPNDTPQPWFDHNMKAFELHEAHPEKTDYRLWPEDDIAYLSGQE